MIRFWCLIRGHPIDPETIERQVIVTGRTTRIFDTAICKSCGEIIPDTLWRRRREQT